MLITSRNKRVYQYISSNRKFPYQRKLPPMAWDNNICALINNLLHDVTIAVNLDVSYFNVVQISLQIQSIQAINDGFADDPLKKIVGSFNNNNNTGIEIAQLRYICLVPMPYISMFLDYKLIVAIFSRNRKIYGSYQTGNMILCVTVSI